MYNLYFRNHLILFQHEIILIILALSAIFFPQIILVSAPLIFFYFLFTDKKSELLITFLLILVLSDSRSHIYAYIKTIKPLLSISLPLVFFYIKKGSVKYSFNVLIPFFIYSILITIAFSDSSFLPLQKVISYSIIWTIPPILIYNQYQKNSTKLFTYLVRFMFLVTFSGILISFISPSFTTLAERYRGLLGNPNGLGLFLTVAYILFETLKEASPKLVSKKWNIIIHIIFFYSLFECGSRASLMSVIIFYTGIYLFKAFKYWSIPFFLIILYSAEYIIDLVPLVTEAIGLSGALRTENTEQIADASGRQIAWTFIWKHINKSGFYFGNGFMATPKIFRVNYDYLSMLGHQGNAHSTYLTFWYDTGLVGLLLWLIGIIVSFFKATFTSSLALPALFAVGFSIYYESWLTASLNPFTITLIIALTLMSIPKETK